MANGVNVTRSGMPPLEEYIEEIAGLWESHWLTNMGEKHNRLEAELTRYLKVDNLSLFSNGHMALEFALQALELKGEVITTPFTFASTPHAIVRNGLTPVFCDVREENGTIDVEQLEALITEKTSAIVPVHVYGNPCDVVGIDALARKHNLKVVYDAAHAFGVELEGRGIGSFGDMSMFSFHATKVFHTVEGGAVCCREPAHLKALYKLKNFGIADAEHVVAVGGNSKMNEFQAAMGLCNLRHHGEEIAARRRLVARYRQGLAGLEGVRVLLDEGPGLKSNYAYMPVFFDEAVLGVNRDGIMEQLAERGIGTRKYFYPLATDYDCYKADYGRAKTPVARRIAAGVLTLPLYSQLPEGKVEEVCGIIREYCV